MEQDFNVLSIIRHPRYNSPVSYAHDIALLLLDRPAKINHAVNTVCLPNIYDNQGQQCTVTGWGLLKHEGASPDFLMQVGHFLKVRFRIILLDCAVFLMKCNKLLCSLFKSVQKKIARNLKTMGKVITN